MYFQTTRDNLLTGITTVQRAVIAKSPLPVLSGILFETNDQGVTMTGSNLDLTISCTVPTVEAVPGAIVLPARHLSEIVRRLPEVPVSFTVDSETHRTELSYGRAQAQINGYDPGDFPRPVELHPKLELSFAGDLFHDLLKRVVYAVGQDELRPIFTGVFVVINDREIRAVATDTHRLALNRIAYRDEVPLDEELQVIISGRAIGELVRILAHTASEELKLTIAENYAAFRVGTTRVLSRLIMGSYPDYQRVIPTSYQTRVFGVDTHMLLQTVERAAILAQDKLPVINFGLESGMLKITAQSEVGSILEEMPVEIQGEPQEVSFNARYLEDALRWCEAPEITLDFNGSGGPALVRPGQEQDDYLALVLPVRFS